MPQTQQRNISAEDWSLESDRMVLDHSFPSNEAANKPTLPKPPSDSSFSCSSLQVSSPNNIGREGFRSPQNAPIDLTGEDRKMSRRKENHARQNQEEYLIDLVNSPPQEQPPQTNNPHGLSALTSMRDQCMLQQARLRQLQASFDERQFRMQQDAGSADFIPSYGFNPINPNDTFPSMRTLPAGQRRMSLGSNNNFPSVGILPAGQKSISLDQFKDPFDPSHVAFHADAQNNMPHFAQAMISGRWDDGAHDVSMGDAPMLPAHSLMNFTVQNQYVGLPPQAHSQHAQAEANINQKQNQKVATATEDMDEVNNSLLPTEQKERRNSSRRNSTKSVDTSTDAEQCSASPKRNKRPKLSSESANETAATLREKGDLGQYSESSAIVNQFQVVTMPALPPLPNIAEKVETTARNETAASLGCLADEFLQSSLCGMAASFESAKHPYEHSPALEGASQLQTSVVAKDGIGNPVLPKDACENAGNDEPSMDSSTTDSLKPQSKSRLKNVDTTAAAGKDDTIATMQIGNLNPINQSDSLAADASPAVPNTTYHKRASTSPANRPPIKRERSARSPEPFNTKPGHSAAINAKDSLADSDKQTRSKSSVLDRRSKQNNSLECDAPTAPPVVIDLIGDDEYVTEDNHRSTIFYSKAKARRSSSCSFTSSHPDMDYQELGADLADTFSEHDRPPNDDNSKEETDDDSHTEEQANSTTKSAKCMNLLGQGRKDLARLRRLSSISAENISHPNESRADEGATTNHDTSDNEQSETVDESKLVGDENATPTNVTDSADIDLKHAEVNEGPVNDLEATDDGLDKTMGENTGVNDDAPSQKSKVESEVINEILQPKISAGEKVMLLKDEDIIVPDDDASSKELVRKREKQDIIAINDDAPSQKLKAEPVVINEIPAHEQKSLAVEEVTILKDDSRCETPSKELTSGRKLRRDHPIIVTSKIAAKKKTRSTKQVEIPSPSDFCKVVPLPNRKSQLEYPHAPMGSIWLNQSLRAEKSSTDTIDLQAGGTLVGRRWVWDEGYFVDARFNQSLNPKNLPLPRCNCGANHEPAVQMKRRNSSSISDSTNGARARRSERSGTSTRMTSVLNQLASGTLSPHTLISCEEYVHGPEYRFQDSLPLEDVQPFSVRVSPDATFLADLHAHLCEAEIIGFLGGHYSAEERCLYIQAAFPCKSTDRQDSGQTDVEMDPVSQIYAKEAIDTHDMSVVGWYHSHPTFQPDPSVTDIENQANYQQLFAESSNLLGSVIPFVGLIVGTYDSRNPTSQSVMRWFHVRNQVTATYKNVQYPMKLKITDRHFRKDIKESSSQVRQEMTIHGADIRRSLEARYISCPLTDSSITESFNEMVVEKTVDDATSTIEDSTYSRSCVEHDDKPKEHSLSGNIVHARLLSEMFKQKPSINATKLKYESPTASSLYFTDIEKSILGMSIDDDAHHDVIGGLIWHAVEREQRATKSGANATSSLVPRVDPPSSSAIFELILRQSFASFCNLDQMLYEKIIHCAGQDSASTSPLKMAFGDSDAVVAHNVDAIISHYSVNNKKVSPFSSWSGAGDKGNIVKGSGSLAAVDDDERKWRDFYLTTILEMQRIEVNGLITYHGGTKKMKRGHKMSACLLKWAAAMQLCPKSEHTAHVSYGCDESFGIDHEKALQQRTPHTSHMFNTHYYFVAEIMRLVAAKWRENSGKASSSSTPIKRSKRSVQPPSTANINPTSPNINELCPSQSNIKTTSAQVKHTKEKDGKKHDLEDIHTTPSKGKPTVSKPSSSAKQAKKCTKKVQRNEADDRDPVKDEDTSLANLKRSKVGDFWPCGKCGRLPQKKRCSRCQGC